MPRQKHTRTQGPVWHTHQRPLELAVALQRSWRQVLCVGLCGPLSDLQKGRETFDGEMHLSVELVVAIDVCQRWAVLLLFQAKEGGGGGYGANSFIFLTIDALFPNKHIPSADSCARCVS